MSSTLCHQCFILISLFFSAGNVDSLKVPKGFLFGVSTASYQVEGGWNSSGKGENIWDRFTHDHPEMVKDHSTGDVACDSFHLWKSDVQILKDVGVNYYRFSLSWSRILPEGFTNKVNEEGVKYYSDLIDELLKNGIEPMVTLYHWDLPQPIQDLGGWTNYITADYFADFARVAFSRYGDRVKTWITINEPYSICGAVYEEHNGAPNIFSPGIGLYICGKAVLLAHAKAYKVYDKEFRDTQGGKVGFTIDSIWAEPKTNASNDRDAAEREMQMSLGWYAHPIYSKTGDYPEIMKTIIADRSKAQNFTRSRLPTLSDQEIKDIRGSADFFGLNHYHTYLVSDEEFSYQDLTYKADKGTKKEPVPNVTNSENIPWGFRKLINWVKHEYDNPLIYITENGIGDTTGTLNDTERVDFLKGFISEAIKSVTEDGCNLSRYTAWSIMDNMEWTDGYTIKFGLYHVDFNDPKRTRTPKASAKFYKELLKKRVL